MKNFVFFFCVLGLSGCATAQYPYSERNAFCVDSARNRSSFDSPSYQYDLTVEYNSCMKNANKLLDRRKEELDPNSELNKRRMKEFENDLKKAREKKRLSEREIQNFGDNLEDYFR